MSDLDCLPYDAPKVPVADASILELAAYASDAANRYRVAMDERVPYPVAIRYASTLARATDALTTAIADEASR